MNQPLKSSPRATGVPGGLALTANDGLSNMVTGMGTAADRSGFSRWSLGNDITYGPFLVDAAQIEAAYRTSALVRRVHDIIPDEMTREWRQWSTDADTITTIEAEEKRLNVEGVVYEALRLARLAGGCGLIMGLPGEVDQEAPETISKGDLKYLIPIPRTLLQIDDLDRDLLSPYFMQPTRYTLSSQNTQARIHPSRVIAFKGLPSGAVRLRSKEDEFWGHPLMESINEQLQNVTMGQNAIAQMLPEALMDVISINNLTDMVSTADGEQRLAKRLQAGKMLASMFKVKVVDGGEGKEGTGESWEQRELTWAGLPEVMRTLFQCLATYAEVPLTRLIGDQAKGLNNGGEQDERNFETNVKTKQKRELKPRLERLDRILLQSAGLKKSPDEMTWTFSPLHIPSPGEQADLDEKTANTFSVLADSGLIQHDALASVAVATLSERPTFAGLQEAVESSSEDIPAVARANMEAEGAAVENKTRLLQTTRGNVRLRSVSRDAFLTDASPRTLYISRKVMNPQEILRHYRGQGLTDLLPARDLHVSIIASMNPVDWMAVPSASGWGGDDGRLRISAGGPRVNDILGSFVVLEFASDELKWRHRRLTEENLILPRWPDFKPHVSFMKGEIGAATLAALKPYTGRILLGPEIFEEVLP